MEKIKKEKSAIFPDLTEGEAFIYRWQYRMLGDFSTALIIAIQRADDRNLDRLARGFPVEVNAYLKYRNIEGWWQEVERKGKLNFNGGAQ